MADTASSAADTPPVSDRPPRTRRSPRDRDVRSARWLFVAGLVGFQFTLAITQPLALESRFVTIPFRVALLATVGWIWLTAVVKGRPQYRGALTLLIAPFWCLLGVQFVRSWNQPALPTSAAEMAALAVLAGVLFLAALRRWSPEAQTATHRAVVIAHIATGVLFVYLFSGYFGTNFGRINSAWAQIAGLEGVTGPFIGSLYAGYLGSTLILLVMHLALQRQGRRIVRHRTLAVVIGVVAGALLLLLSASRGPVIAIVATLALFSFRNVQHRLGRTLAAWTAVGLIGLAVVMLAEDIGSQLVDRVMNLATLFNPSPTDTSFSRFSLLQETGAAVLAHPVLGVGLRLASGGHPHNAFAEAFFVTGLFGGLCYAIFILTCAWRAFRGLTLSNPNAWICVLFFHAFFAAQFSGSIVTNHILWLLAGGVLAQHQRRPSPPPTAEPPAPRA